MALEATYNELARAEALQRERAEAGARQNARRDSNRLSGKMRAAADEYTAPKNLAKNKSVRKWQKDIVKFERAIWIVAFTIAIAKDVLDVIPIINIIFTPFLALYIIVFVWRLGAKKERLFYYAVLAIDIVPILGILPLSTGLLFFLHRNAENRAKHARKKLHKIKSHLESDYL